MRKIIFFVLIILINQSCRQIIVHEKNMKNAKKMAGVWEVYEVSTGALNGTIIYYYNIDNELEANFAYYFRTSGITSSYYWWMEKDDYLFLLNRSSNITFTYQILEINNKKCKLKQEDGSELLLIRKVKS